MGRPDLSDTRTIEILDAFARCVARYGLEGSSLQKVADEAGMQRSILRHYVGNREELVVSLAERVVAGYEDQLQAYFASETKQDPGRRVLDYLFGDGPSETTEGLLVVEALIAEGATNPTVRELMAGYIDKLVGTIANELHQMSADSTRKQCWTIAYGVVAICFNNESLKPLGMAKKYQQASRACAQMLIDGLRE